MTASVETSVKSAIFSRISSGTGRSERRTITSGWMPIARSSRTECWVGFVLSSPVGFGAVVGDEHLAVLVRRHRPGVDVDVRVELEDRDPEAACLEDAADAGGGDAFAQRGGHPSGHKDIFSRAETSRGFFECYRKW